MTKNVELHLHKWSKMKGALGSVTETGSGGGFSGSQGFANRIKSLVEITEKAKRTINELDVDGAIGNLYFHDDHVTAISLQSKLTALETYAGKVQQYLKDKIDQPFYEKLDKVGNRLEALNISDYKTSNQIGFKKTEVIYSEAGQYMGTRENLAKEVGLKELYQVDNPYKKRLQAMYEAYKSSDDYKESKLSEEDYLFASHQTRAFTYHSLNDEKAAFEGKRDLLLAAGVVILTIFCPPAGAVAGVALAAADMYSAASGKDWMTGRELDDGERLMRGAFALFDLVPGVGYLNDLAKTGKVAGLAGIKASLKTSFKEGMEQATKNVDNFKVVLKNVDDFGKRVVTKIDDFGKQLDILVTNKVSSLADNVAGKLRHADETISTAAQNFRLNIGLEPQLIDGFMPTPPPGKLSGLADNIQAFAKNLDGSVDEVMESGGKLRDNILSLDLSDTGILNTKPKNSPAPQKWLDKGGKIEIDYSKLPPEWIYTDWEGNIIKYTDGFPDFKGAGYVNQEVLLEEGFESRTRDFAKADKLAEYPKSLDATWHHHQDGKTLQEIETRIHARFTHKGGFALRKK
ncbi:HNH endonuclease [Streptococcus suis]|uniref:HNH endonuclease n=2 Tax=Streptococcus suis TaxID=1307 RepID=UPI000CF4501E|nr:HNH endonuclease [Streptococcus suis]MBO4107922.1 HNH endonuclease [Streptococcus suis]